MNAVAFAIAPDAELDDLVAEALAIIHEEGEPVRLAVPRVLASMTPDSDATQYLIRVGLIAVVHDRINGTGGRDAEAEVQTEIAAATGRSGLPRLSRITIADRALRAMERNYESADGRRKALADFTLADCLHLQTSAEAKAHGLTMLAKAMEVGAGFLRSGKFKTLGSLPDAKRQEVAQYVVRVPEGKE